MKILIEQAVIDHALEALGCIESSLYVREINKVGAAMKALRQAKEQAQQAETVVCNNCNGMGFVDGAGDLCQACNGHGAPPPRQPLTDEQILANDVLRYYFGLNGGAGPVSGKGRKIINAIEVAHGIKGGA